MKGISNRQKMIVKPRDEKRKSRLILTKEQYRLVKSSILKKRFK